MVRSSNGKDKSGSARAIHAPPEVALLSNGQYSVLVTEGGAGYASWRGLDVTRWREDSTRDCWGQFCYIRDVEDNKVWAISLQPIRRADAAYERSFHPDRAEFRCSAGDIDVSWEICVAPDCDAEVRLIRLFNRGAAAKKFELTSYCEICLNGRRVDSAHPAFAKLFVETWFDPETGALFARRRPRSATEKPVWAVHVSASSEDSHPSVDHETDRYRFLGRGRTSENPKALEQGAKLSGTTGPVLDPILSLRRTVLLKPFGMERVAFVTGAADSNEATEIIAKRFASIHAADRALSVASSTPSPGKLVVYNRLAGGLAFSHPAFRDGNTLRNKRLNKDGLWSVSISGDLPILLLRIDGTEGKALIQDVVDAHTFISSRGLRFDLVLLDERSPAETERLNDKLKETLEDGVLGKPGGVFLLSTAAISSAALDAIPAAARVTLYCSRGSISSQLHIGSATVSPALIHTPAAFADQLEKRGRAAPADLLYWNGFGGFSPDGREYVIATDVETKTPTPWCNVIANPEFGCLTSESGLGYSWTGNSQLNRLSPWSNDPVSDTPGEIVYLRDEQTGELWTPTPLPLGKASGSTVRHGQGYTHYESDNGSLHHEMTVHAPVSAPIKVVRLAIRNDGTETRSLTATYFVELVLGTLREDATARIECEFDGESHSIVARNLWESEFSGELAFIASSMPVRSFTCNRAEFLGRNGSVYRPKGLQGSNLSGSAGVPIDPCAALMVDVSVSPTQSVEVVFILGQADNHDEVRNLIYDYAEAGHARRSLAEVSSQWDRILNAVAVRTPDKAFDLMMNRWLLYQVLCCRVWARSGFYQSGGAYGFRDQLQDVMALVHSAPDETRAQILRAAAHQFPEGDVMHWWHPPTGRGVRTRMTDDLYFLPYVVHHYISATGDYDVLKEVVPFITLPILQDDQEELFDVPQISHERGTVYEHCCRALEHGLRLGSHGLPLIGTGDWNDGMNRVGAEGKGESVWNGWFFLTVLNSFATIASDTGDESRAVWCRERAEALRTALEAHAWDGAWYRRAYFDDGAPLGSSVNDECQIDAIPQAWAVISGVADAERASSAMRAVWERLVRPHAKLIQLFDPPFDKGVLQPGYIKGYVPGIRENGGQYTHAASWVVLATALLGDGDRAFQLWDMINPVTHARSADEARHYMAEPYIVCADVYGAPPHTGRGGWTWYTGSASWLYRVGLEAILGIRRQGGLLSIEPCIPTDWPGFELDLRHGSATYRIKVSRGTERSLVMDGEQIDGGKLPLADDGRIHHVQLIVG